MNESQQWSSNGPMWDNADGASRPPAKGALTPAEGLAEPSPLRAEVRLMEASYPATPPVNSGSEPAPLSECLPAVLAEMIRREARAKRGDR